MGFLGKIGYMFSDDDDDDRQEECGSRWYPIWEMHNYHIEFALRLLET